MQWRLLCYDQTQYEARLLTSVADLHSDDEEEEEDEASAPTLVACCRVLKLKVS